MPEIVLATLNAKYIHASLGLRCLRANLGELRGRSVVAEYTIQERPLDVAERLLALQPRIVGLGVYVWNVAPTTELVALLKRIRPDLIVVVGGPEVSHETGMQEIVRLADCTVCGEGDVVFAEVCRAVLGGRGVPAKVLPAHPPEVEGLQLPYSEYSDTDLAQRLVYVEASRGCAFGCEFCLSSLDTGVRVFRQDRFLGEIEGLLARGARHFKFIDRTFNLHLPTARRILEFFLARMAEVPAGDGAAATRYPGVFVHFEMVPDRLPGELRELIARFPPGAMQLEVGIQTFDPAVAAAINRRQDNARAEENLRYLRSATAAHVHADLIVGLPGETVAGFAQGFDRLVGLGPQEIQVGILKKLRGAPIARHDGPEQMVYSPMPPYEILRNRLIAFPEMQRLRRFARYWDLVGNSGNFVETLPLFWMGAASVGARAVATDFSIGLPDSGTSPFAELMHFADWYFSREGRHHALALQRTIERVFEFLVHERGMEPAEVAKSLAADCRRAGSSDLPPSVRPFAPMEMVKELAARRAATAGNTRRQARHLG